MRLTVRALEAESTTDSVLRQVESNRTELVQALGQLRRARAELEARKQAHRAEVASRRELEVALRNTLAAVSSAAFIVSRYAVAGANPRGTAELEREGDALRERLRNVVETTPSDSAYDVTPTGTPGEFVVVRRESSNDVESRFERATARWGLSKRQADVLRGLVDGQPNTKIAERIGCNTRTVETHVAGLLGRADAGSRLELVAAFWWDV